MHFTVIVIGDNPEKQLAPYDEQLTDEVGNYNPYGFWDWFQLGGRWTGFFKLKEGATGKINNPEFNAKKVEEGYADQALKKDIDFETMTKDCIERNKRLYDNINKILNKHPKIITWNELKEKYKCNDCFEEKYNKCISKVKDEYWTQPAIKEILTSDYVSPVIDVFELEQFLKPKEEYLSLVKYEDIVPYAFIENGRWIAKGEMGWFFSNDKMSQTEWNKVFFDSLNKLPDDTLLSLYDCHI